MGLKTGALVIMKILVTGHRGYIGAELTKRLPTAWDVAGIDTDLYRECNYQPLPEVTTLLKDIREIALDDLAGVDCIVHLAGLSNDPLGHIDPKLTFAINHDATKHLASLAATAKVKHFVFASSCANYGMGSSLILDEQSPLNPVTPYGESKVMAEHALLDCAGNGMAITCLRFATVYGVSPRLRLDLVVNEFVWQALTHNKIILKSSGEAWRPFVHIDDICRVIICSVAAEPTAEYRIFNIVPSGENYQILEVAHKITALLPDCECVILEDSQHDTRCYQVSGEAWLQAMPDFQYQWQLVTGIKDMLTHCRFDNVNSNFYRLSQLQMLRSSGQLDQSFHWDR